GQQQILGGGEDRRRQGALEGLLGGRAHLKNKRGASEAARCSPVDIGEDRRVGVGLLVGAGAAFPDLSRQLGDTSADLLLFDDDEYPRLLVLGAGGEGGGVEDLRERVVVDLVGREVAACPLAVDDVEEVRHRRA